MSDYEFEEELLDEVFDLSKEYLRLPRQPGEFTVSMMAERYTIYGRRHWNDKLDEMVEDGILARRVGKRDTKYYRIIDDSSESLADLVPDRDGD